jgi:hypothetical protein
MEIRIQEGADEPVSGHVGHWVVAIYKTLSDDQRAQVRDIMRTIQLQPQADPVPPPTLVTVF